MTAYNTIRREAVFEFTERRSRFLGYIKPVTTEGEALAFLEGLRKKHWDATHNVYAYALREGNVKRYSDDGEPQGTAGVPVLSVLEKQEIVDAIIVVTRYFGGILLGGGGLVRAYGHAASGAVGAGEVKHMELCRRFTLSCDYAQYGKIQGVLLENGAVLDSTEFLDIVRLNYYLPAGGEGALQKELDEASCGSLHPELIEETFLELTKGR